MSYAESKKELDEVVRAIQVQDIGLEEAMTLWARGEELVGQCQEYLDAADARIAATLGAS